MKKVQKKEKEKNNLLRNLKMMWKLTKGSRKYLISVGFFSITLSVVGAIIPTFSAKQILYLNNSIICNYISFII